MQAVIEGAHGTWFDSANGIVPRPRVERALAEASKRALALVVAGTGYGKTQAVRDFVNGSYGQGAATVWVTLKESDNDVDTFWENFIEAVGRGCDSMSEQLRALGFPYTSQEFDKHMSLMKNLGYAKRKIFLAFDDVHLITNEQILRFIERTSRAPFPQLRAFLISQREPVIDMVSLLSKHKVNLIDARILRFTDDEIVSLFRQEGIQCTARTLARVSRETHGWARALHLLTVALKRIPYEETEALRATKQNLFELMEREAFEGFSEEIKKVMVKLSLVPRLPLELLKKFVGGNEDFFKSDRQIASYVWYDSFAGYYRAHPLYMEFLSSKHDILEEDEKQELYSQTAEWCVNNNFHLYALNCYAKMKDYDGMLAILMSYPIAFPRDVAEFSLRVMEGLNPADCENIGSCALMKYTFQPRILNDLGRHEEAEELFREGIAKWKHSDAPFAHTLRYSCHNGLGLAKMVSCVKTHEYDFDKYCERALEIFKQNPVPPWLTSTLHNASVRTFAFNIGVGAKPEEFGQYLRALKNAVHCSSQILNGFSSGYYELAECELAVYRSQMDQARIFAQQAITKAQENNQYGIETTAVYYLFRMALAEGDFQMVDTLLASFKKKTENPAFVNGKLVYESLVSWLYVKIGMYTLAPNWLRIPSALSEANPMAPAWAHIICTHCLIASKKYDEALVYIHTVDPHMLDGTSMLGELVRFLLSAIARQKTGDEKGALADFERSYSHSMDGELNLPYVEMGRNACSLIKLAMKYGTCIPTEWLKDIDLRAAAYAKKIAVVSAAYKKQHNIEDNIHLSERETQILRDLYQGLSRQEIAATRYISINTVKTMIQALYQKLNVESSMEAVRIAIERGWV
ncbi:MAG: LuxR C-terminal-related transcriptional regulator [Clostridiales Family XIII bacterium]|jgi:LuxR family maltose regulon positive regulatory protein|nr:LuxR C-terminal-related transcriptional regulator [Clostridiales Family XIII bacterium]